MSSTTLAFTTSADSMCTLTCQTITISAGSECFDSEKITRALGGAICRIPPSIDWVPGRLVVGGPILY